MITKATISTIFRYIKEVLIIVLGVSISFLVDKCKNEQQDKATEATLIMSLRQDLTKDSIQLAAMLVHTKDMVSSVQKIYDNLEDFTPIEDSLHYAIRGLTSSSVFTPTNMTYEEMKQNGFSKLLKNQILRRNIYELYCNYYEDLKVVSDKVGMRIELNVSPLLQEQLPFKKTLNYSPSQVVQITRIFKQDRYRNLVRMSLSDHKMSLNYYEITYEKVIMILDLLRKR
jgi:Family of unknown function (DUF6090)